MNRIIHEPDWFDLLRNNQIQGDYEGQISWKKVEKAVDSECTYDEHVKRVEGKANGRIEKLREEMQDLRAERLAVRRKTMVEFDEKRLYKGHFRSYDGIKAIDSFFKSRMPLPDELKP